MRIDALLLCLAAAPAVLSSASETVPLEGARMRMESGRFAPTWDSFVENYRVPEWFRDAKFGIWAHWGPQCVEGSGDWMARSLYMEGSREANHHRRHYGHPSEIGFKDVLPHFTAEKWDPDALVAYYKSIGARYFFALGNHHDNFDLWNSSFQPWNSVNMGPRRDVLAAWSAAAKKAGLPFGVSFHADHAWTWYEPSRRHDTKGEFKDRPYDGRMTRADGKGKWWEGFDPQDLYAQNHPLSRDSWNNGAIHGQWAWGNGACLPSAKFVANFFDRTVEAIDKYGPDMIYFDATVLPFEQISDCGRRIVAHMYNRTERTKGHPGVVMGKILDERQRKGILWDVERGAPDRIVETPWQTCTCLGGWHYNDDIYRRGLYKSAAQVVRLLADVVSKNGNMLLSVPLRADGTFDEKEAAVLKELGEWMNANGEAIYATRSWSTFGEGPVAEARHKLNAQGFNEGAYLNGSAAEIRFTRSKDGSCVYAIASDWPADGSLRVKSLRALDPVRVTLLCDGSELGTTLSDDALSVSLPRRPAGGRGIAPVLKVELAASPGGSERGGPAAAGKVL